MPNLSALSMSLKVSLTGSGQVNVTGDDYSPISQKLQITKNVGPFVKSVANNASLGADECYSAITTIPASGNATVNLQNLTDIIRQSGVSLARVKGYLVRLLSTQDDADNGTACTGITINGAGTNLATLPGLTNTTLSNGDFLAWATPSAAGITVSPTTENLYLANNDAVHPAAVQISAIGGTT